MNKFSKFMFKLVISISMLIFVLSRVDLAALLGRLILVDITYLVMAIGVGILATSSTTLTWKILLDATEIKIKYFDLLKLNMIGKFFNLFLPTNMGGDVYKVYGLSKDSGDGHSSIASVVMVRVLGLVSLSLILLVGILFGKDVLPKEVIFSALLMSFGILFAIILVYKAKQFVKLITKKSRFEKHVKYIILAFSKFKNDKKRIFLALGSSLFFHLISCVFFYLFAKSLFINIDLFYFFLFIPMTNIVLIAPISFNGVGVKEGMFAVLFASVGMVSADAVSISIIAYTSVLVHSVIGLICYVRRH